MTNLPKPQPPTDRVKRIDTEGRDVTDLPGLWDESDTFIKPTEGATAKPTCCDMISEAHRLIPGMRCTRKKGHAETFHNCGDYYWKDLPPAEPAAPAPATQANEWRRTLLGPLKEATPAVLKAMIVFHAKRALLAEQRIARLEEAIKWAMGERGEFPNRAIGEGTYWWRKELRRRAALAATEGETQ